jgi:hypothetical protein
MDTETVFKIISMLSARMEVCERFFNGETDEDYDTATECGKFEALEEFRDYLQNYIELQVAQVEGT